MVSALDLVDVGANLSHDSFRHDLPEVLERAREAGVAQMIVTGASESESRAAHDIAAAYPGVLFSTAGVHPHLAKEWSDDTASVIRELARSPVVVAVGEAGLDFNRDFSPRPVQERVFSSDVDRLREALEAHDSFVAILGEYRSRLGPAVIHCFTGDDAQLERYLEMDLHVGITGWICDERRGTHLRELVARIPPERLLLETDSPYLLPRDLKPRPKSRRNEPMHLAHILESVAACRRDDPRVLADATTRSARRFFGIEAA